MIRKGSVVEEYEESDDEMDVENEGQMKSLKSREHYELTLSLKVHQGDGEVDEQEQDEVDIHNPQQVQHVKQTPIVFPIYPK